MNYKSVTFWLLKIFLTLVFSSVAFAELDATSYSTANLTLLDADKLLISPVEKALAVSVDLSYNSNFLSSSDANYRAESFVAVSSRYQISPKLSIGEQIGVIQKLDDSQHTDLSNMKVQLTYEATAKDSDLSVKYNLFSYLPTSADDRSQTTYQGGVGAGFDLVKNYALPGLQKPGQISYGFSALKNLYQNSLDYTFKPNMSYRLRHTVSLNQHLSKYFSVQLSGFYQNAIDFENGQHSFFQMAEIVNYQSSKNVSFYVGHTNEADALEDDGIDTNYNLYDANESYFVSGAKISF